MLSDFSRNEALIALQSGNIKKWNAARQKDPAWQPDLNNLDLPKNVVGADFRNCIGLKTSHFSGKNLEGVILPDGWDFDFGVVNQAARNARNLFLTMLISCFYGWLSIGTTSDLNLLVKAGENKLPIIGATIPTIGFYLGAPLLIIGLSLYFHLYLRRFWELFCQLPETLPRGNSSYDCIFPWLVNSLISPSSKCIERVQTTLASVLVFLSCPLTILGLWFRYLPRHDLLISSIQVIVLGFALGFSIHFFRLKSSFFKKQPEVRGIGLIPSVLFMLFFGFLTLHLTEPNKPWSVRADLSGKDISERPLGWTYGDDLRLVRGAFLREVNLQSANCRGVFLVCAELEKANLSYTDLKDAQAQNSNFKFAVAMNAKFDFADLTYSKFNNSDLRRATFVRSKLNYSSLDSANFEGSKLWLADLSCSDLSNAQFQNSDLYGANLQGANLWKSNFFGADLSSANLLGVSNLNFSQIKGTCISTQTILPEELWDAVWANQDLINIIDDQGYYTVLPEKVRDHTFAKFENTQ